MGLLVVDPEADAFYRQRGVKVTASMADASWVPFKVRKLSMVKGPDGYGFLLKEEKCRSGKRGEWLFQGWGLLIRWDTLALASGCWR